MRVGVVGGGIAGLATAHYLARAGAEPFVVDAGRAGGGCSLGNAGWVCPSISTPLPGPGLTLRSLAWMLKADSPLYIRPAALPRLLPWLLRFRARCNRTDWERGVAALAGLNSVTMERYDELAREMEFEFAAAGVLMVFRDSGKAAAARAEVEAVAAVGAASCRELDEDELYAREPLLRPGFRFGVFVDAERHVRPESLTAALARSLRARGVAIHEGARATGFRFEGGGGSGTVKGRRARLPGRSRPAAGGRATAIVVQGRGGSADEMEADAVVLAAGVHTGELAGRAGWPIPLTAGKGYSVTIERPARQLRQPLYLGGAKIGLTPFGGALRIAGTMELSGINTRMDRSRIASLRRQVLRDVDIPEAEAQGRAWVGMRPMVPDTLPVVGPLPSCENVFVNAGHQMLGVTLAPSCGWALAGLMVEGRAGVGLEAFAAGRFQGG